MLSRLAETSRGAGRRTVKKVLPIWKLCHYNVRVTCEKLADPRPESFAAEKGS
jgi:hypothetical protein